MTKQELFMEERAELRKRIAFLQRNIGDWTEADADEVCNHVSRLLSDLEAASSGVTREEWDALIAAEMVKHGQHAHHENLLVDIRNAIVARLSSVSPAPAVK